MPREKAYICKECGKDYNEKKNRKTLFPAHVRRCTVSKFKCECPDAEEMQPNLSKEDTFESYKRKAQHIQVMSDCLINES